MANRKLPQTSLDAYKQAVPDMINAHHSKILAALRLAKNGMMYEQIAAHTRMDKHQVGRRLSELEAKQLIYNTKERRKTASNREAFVYKLTAAGEEYIIPQEHLPGKTISQYSKDIKSVQADLFSNP